MKSRYILLFISLLIVVPFFALAEEKNPAKETEEHQKGNNILTLTIDQYSEDIPQDILELWIKKSIFFSLSYDARSEFENTSYCPADKIFCALTLTEMQHQRMRLSSQTLVDTNAVNSYIEDLARKIDCDPEDAKFQITNGKVTTFSEAKDGISLDTQKSVAAISEALNANHAQIAQTIALPFNVKKADINYGDVNNLGIASLIGKGTSNFKGSTASRIHNVKIGAARFNGLLIKPGEEFSFVKNLGEVDAEHGYLPELVIKKNKTEPEFGGGICQVSTTAFRAAIYSGLKITARKNHAYPVSYYNPQGMDSTVYVPNPDLRFINNTPGYILIQTKIDGTILTFDFYGTDDGRKTEIIGPTVLEKKPDGSMKTTFTQHVFNKDGEEIIKDVFNSSYDSPYKYPHPGEQTLTVKPANWSENQWKDYKKNQKNIANNS